jgi:hypothetical protein
MMNHHPSLAANFIPNLLLGFGYSHHMCALENCHSIRRTGNTAGDLCSSVNHDNHRGVLDQETYMNWHTTEEK